MAGGIIVLVGLGFDDDATDAAMKQRAADQLRRDPAGRAVEEGPIERAAGSVINRRARDLELEPRRQRRPARLASARSSCAATAAAAVPPRETFDSSHEPSPSTS